MAYQPLTYPATLTKAYWDKKKSLAAKAAGETGVGQAAADAQKAFSAIDWDQFDVVKHSPLGSGDEDLKLAQQLKGNVVAEHAKSVKPTIADLRVLRAKAKAAAETLKKGKLTKDDAKLAEAIQTEADQFSVELQLNSVFFDKVAKECDTTVKNIENSQRVISEAMAKTKEFLAQLLTGLASFQKKNPQTPADWDKLVKQQGRSVSNNLKGNPALAKKYLKTWATKFQGFDWVTLGFAKIESEDDLKGAIAEFTKEVVKEAVILRKDLG